jgi:mono/diheme cytochrome c family protein
MQHRWRKIAGLVVLAVGTAGTPLGAQERGDAERGAQLARSVCIACHGIRPGENSVNPEAPPFPAIAASRGMSAMALHVALLSPHRAMPNIVLDARERADIVAYILGMK